MPVASWARTRGGAPAEPGAFWLWLVGASSLSSDLACCGKGRPVLGRSPSWRAC